MDDIVEMLVKFRRGVVVLLVEIFIFDAKISLDRVCTQTLGTSSPNSRQEGNTSRPS